MLVLGIESSCDETAVAVVADGRRVLSNVIASQIEVHTRFGGVVPEVASRKHLENLLPTLEQGLREANVTLADIDAIAVTHGPGLVGALLVGLSAAKALAFARDLPLIGVNHLHGHIYANWLTEEPPQFPAVCLIVSGGHTDLLYLADHGQLEVLGRTRDDAAGEAFDKVARAMGLGYPGGPKVEALAREGDASRIELPRALPEGYDFSFSGLKTAVLHYVQKQKTGFYKADLAAAFQQAVIDVLVEKTVAAAQAKGVKQVLLAGGVAANGALREALAQACAAAGLALSYPPLRLCTDNAAMIAAAGYYAWQAGQTAQLDLPAVATLSL